MMMRDSTRRAVLAALLAVSSLGSAAVYAEPPGQETGPVLELRQYKIVAGRRDDFIRLFEQKFVESQEDLGVRLVGQFRDTHNPDRFVWVRQFPDMAARLKALNAFYYGPVWKANRETANPMLDDNDNVLLLRPAWPGSGFANAIGKRAVGQEMATAGLVVVTIHYLWKDPDTGFSKFFQEQLGRALADAGLPTIGAFVTETTPNDFPRLPVRQTEKVFVTFTRVTNHSAYERGIAKLRADPRWTNNLDRSMADFEERSPQILELEPTPRSRLR